MYSFVDEKPIVGNNFYRLKQIDRDSKMQISKIEKVFFTKAATINLSPNPARDIVNITLTNIEGAITIQVINNSGQVVKQQSLVNASSTKIPVTINGLNPGIYLVKVLSTGNKIFTKTFIVQ